MTLKKNELEDIEKKFYSQHSDNKMIEDIAMPIFIERMDRYGKIMRKVYENLVLAGFNDEQALRLTGVMLDFMLHSPNVELQSVTDKDKPRGYA